MPVSIVKTLSYFALFKRILVVLEINKILCVQKYFKSVYLKEKNQRNPCQSNFNSFFCSNTNERR